MISTSWPATSWTPCSDNRERRLISKQQRHALNHQFGQVLRAICAMFVQLGLLRPFCVEQLQLPQKRCCEMPGQGFRNDNSASRSGLPNSMSKAYRGVIVSNGRCGRTKQILLDL
jgi:hypothetical protein